MKVLSRSQRARRDHRGASLPEYALVVALISVGVIGSFDLLATGAQKQFDGAGEGIAVSEDDGGDATPTTTEAPTPTTAPPTTSPPTSSPPTTAPPTTTPPTTAPPTTAPPTTAPPTTAPPAPTTTITEWGPATTRTSGKDWELVAPLTITDEFGDPVAGATVTIQVSYRIGSTWHHAPVQASEPTTEAGSLTVSSGLYPNSGKPSERVAEIRLTIVSVTGGPEWQPGQTDISAAAP